MLLQALAAGLILFSCGAMGLIFANSYAKRVHNIRQLMTFVQVLESEIQFALTTLPNFIASQANQFSGEIAQFLQALSTKIKAGTGERFSDMWKEATGILAENGLPEIVLEDLRSLGDILGTSDTSDQSKHLKIFLHRLEQALKVAEDEREKQTRLWQYLGFSAGLLIVLILL